VLPLTECIKLQEIAFADHARGGGMNAPSTWLRVTKHRGWMKLLAGFVDETDAMGIKVLARYPNNPPGMNLGSLIVLFDATNGFPLAIFDGVYITAVRTGAGAGIATAHCARPDSRVIGLLGTGVVARFSLLATCLCCPDLKDVYVYSRSEERRTAFAHELAAATGARIIPVATPREAVADADVIITATNSPEPSLFADWVRPGTHINAMGIKQEIEPIVFRGARIFGDARDTAVDDGKFGVAVQAGAVPADAITGEIGDVLIGKAPGRTSDQEITIFDSSGLAVQDIVCAHYVYQQAAERNLGVEVDLGLGDEP
jgi:alanine dehydrogenase